jgi:hypothetical protein
MDSQTSRELNLFRFPLLVPRLTSDLQRLTVYETNVRGILRLRKRLKKADYAIIHRFARSQGWEKYDVYLNETLIPWSKYWKEYRRSGAREQPDTGKR